VEAQVLQQHDGAAAGAVDGVLDSLADAVVHERDLLRAAAAAKQLFQLRHHGPQAVLVDALAVGPAQVRHEHHRLGAVLNGILDGGDGADDALIVGNALLRVERHVKVDL
jgi:hypothetical protein